jgi:hypothetical protein
MSEVVLRVAGLKVAYGGLRATRFALLGVFRAPPLPVPPPAGGGSAQCCAEP